MFSIPRFTYIGVPMSIFHARCGVVFRDEDWQGEYELQLMPRNRDVGSVWDAARRFRSGMFNETHRPKGNGFVEDRFQCVSFHITKICGHSQGGAILHNNGIADKWLRRARFDGRTEGVPPTEDTFDMLGWHAYMSPDVAAALRWKLASLPAHNADLPRDNYADLSLAPIFSGKTPA
jgi:hypothetical protein